MGTNTRHHRKALSGISVCGICLLPFSTTDRVNVDHILPLSLGGSNDVANVQLTHVKCNRRKGNKTNYVPINLRKERCKHCNRYFKSVKTHIKAKHEQEKEQSNV